MTVADSVNGFALDLYGRLRGEPGNVFMSPASIALALGMACAGARGKTAGEMKKALRFEVDDRVLHPALGRLLEGLSSKDSGVELALASALWVRKGLVFDEGYLSLVKGSYGAGPREVDYDGDPEEARGTINAWVEEQTFKKIKELLLKGDVTEGTRFVLTNAIYFKGLWKLPFKREDTIGGASWWKEPSKPVAADMMRIGKSSFKYMRGGGLSALELPYEGGKVSMVVVLPDAKHGLPGVESALNAGSLGALLGKMGFTELAEVQLPRFKVTARYDMVEKLKALGMKLPFENEADFSGIAPKEPLKISKVIHKAFVDVNEEGTEAAAATAMTMVAGCIPTSAPKRFIADHPFLFFIRDTATGAILFMGRLADPTKTGE